MVLNFKLKSYFRLLLILFVTNILVACGGSKNADSLLIAKSFHVQTIQGETKVISLQLVAGDDSSTLVYKIVDSSNVGGELGQVYDNNKVKYKAVSPGSYKFSYVILGDKSGRKKSNIATVTIKVTAKNTAPTAKNISNITLTVGETKAITLEGIDPENDPLDYIVAAGTPVSVGVLSQYTDKDNQVSFKANAKGVYRFTYKVSDGRLESNIATVTIHVTAKNTAPTAKNISNITLTVGETKAITLEGIDPENDPLDYIVAAGTPVSVGVLSQYTDKDNQVSFKANAKGVYRFTYKVSDGRLESNIATVTITVVPKENIKINLHRAVLLSSTGLLGIPREVLVKGTFAFVAAEDGGLHVFSNIFSKQPKRVKTLNVGGDVRSILLSSDRNKLFVAADDAGLVIVDVSVSTNPKVIGSIGTNYLAEDLALSNDEKYVYVADGKAGITIVDVSNNSRPKLQASTTMHGLAYAYKIKLSADGDYAYIATKTGGLNIVDITNPLQLVLIDHISTGDGAYGIELSLDGNTAYVASGKSGVTIVDITNPYHATKINTWIEVTPARYKYPISVVDVKLLSDGVSLLVAGSSPGVYLINVSDSRNLVRTDYFDPGSFSIGLTLSGDETKLIVADFVFGLLVYDIRQ